MAHIDKHVAKDNKLTYRFKVHRGCDPATGKQLTPYSMTWEPPSTWSEDTCDKRAPAEAAKFEQRCKDGKIVSNKKSFYDYALLYIQRCRLLGRKHKTVLGYEQALEIVNPHIGYLQMSSITPHLLNDMYAKLLNQNCKRYPDKKVSTNTVAKYARFVSAVFKSAEKDNVVVNNAAKRSAAPTYKQVDPVYYQPEDIDKIISALENEPIKWKTVVYLYLSTGKRRGEILGLEWNRIDLENSVLDISKSLLYTPKKGVYLETLKENNPQSLKIPQGTTELLKEYKIWYDQLKEANGDRWEEGDFVFVQDNGLPMHPDSVNNWLRKFEKRHNLPHLNPKAFRHTVASMLYFNGFDSVTVADQLNHKRVSTTENHYAHIIKKARARATECVSDVIFKNKQKN